jgi:hypothetical protein
LRHGFSTQVEVSTIWGFQSVTITKRIFEKRNLRWAVYGALFFWTPDILIHAIKRYQFDNPILVSLACPLTLVSGYFIVAFFSAGEISTLHPALATIGIWCTGGFATMLASSFAGGGLANPDGWLVAVGISFLTVVFPPLTLMLATYDGSLFALLVATLLMVIEMAGLPARIMQLRFSKTGI